LFTKTPSGYIITKGDHTVWENIDFTHPALKHLEMHYTLYPYQHMHNKTSRVMLIQAFRLSN